MGTGKGYYWKPLAGALHSGDHWVMAVLAQTREQLCCSVVTKQVFLDTAMLSPNRGEVRKGALNIVCSHFKLDSPLQRSGYPVTQSYYEEK